MNLYRVHGQRVPSVTEVLELAGVRTLPDVPSSLLEHKRMIGAEVHDWCQMMDEGMCGVDEIDDPEVENYVRAYTRFLTDLGPTLVGAEQTVINDTYRYAGTLDRRFRFGAGAGEVAALVDLKCGQPAPWTGLQLAGYEMCIPEPHRRYALWLRNDRTYRLIKYEEMTDKHDFLACVRVAHYRLRHGQASIT